MVWIRLLIILLVLVAMVYYAMLIMHCFGVIKFTSRKINFGRMIIPFYYWLMPSKERNHKK